MAKTQTNPGPYGQGDPPLTRPAQPGNGNPTRTVQAVPRADAVLFHMLEKAKGRIAEALPRHLTPERMIRMAMTVFHQTPDLQRCNPTSILACVIQASQLGLELSGPLGHAWMVPYGGTAQFQVGYRGFIELAFRSGKVASFPMRTVHENDKFRVFYGTKQGIEHEQHRGDRGPVIGYYSVLYLKGGGENPDFEFMSKADIDQHMKRYVKNLGKSSPWVTAYDAMAMKTTVRRLAKRAPLSTEMQIAVGADEAADLGGGAWQGLAAGELLPGPAEESDRVTAEQLQQLDALARTLEMGQEEWDGMIQRVGAEAPELLSRDSADELLKELGRRVEEAAGKGAEDA